MTARGVVTRGPRFVGRLEEALKVRPTRLIATILGGAVPLALVRGYLDGTAPLPHAALATALAALLVATLGSRRAAAGSVLRAGYYVGLLGFLLVYPLYFPGDLRPARDAARETAGWCLVLGVVGFELGYWVYRRPTRWNLALRPGRRLERWLWRAISLAVGFWALSIYDVMQASGGGLDDVLLTMRGQVQGEGGSGVSMLGYLGVFTGAASFAGATAACLLLAIGRRTSLAGRAVLWAALLVCAYGGFVAGSRGVFAFAAMPLVAALWRRFGLHRPEVSRTRVAAVALGAVLAVAVAWYLQSSLRGGDVRRQWDRAVEGGFRAGQHAEGAFHVFWALELVVDGFPDRIPYEYGRSLVPVVLGWVPRPLWPGKPYPFSQHATTLLGETQERRSASIACTVLGEGYGNFGLLGVVLWTALFGFAARRGDEALQGMDPSHPSHVQLCGMGAAWCALLVRGGVAEIFYMGFFPVLLSVVILVAVSRLSGPR